MKFIVSNLVVCGSVRRTTRACDCGSRVELIPPSFYSLPTGLRETFK